MIDTELMDEPETCGYDLDTDLRIVGVDSRWSKFAAANQAPELVPPPGPLGQSALSCVADHTSALIYAELFERVLRTGQDVVFPIRCDSPTRRRYLRLTISPRSPDGLHIETTLTRAENRPPVALLERDRPRGSDLLRMCGWCKSTEVAGAWLEVEEAVAALRLFEGGPLPRVSHGICPPCLERMCRELDLMPGLPLSP